ncbi:MAG TPA: hypothetical protein VM286_08815 [Candidatus Thermoplasmatota archaeon]|nr:hypothetical protein [Candidatus Thermoplasmatota archaeon]
MAPTLRRVRLASLLRAELMALPRNTFALAAVAAVFGILAVPLSFLYSGTAGLMETLLLAWYVLPLVVSVIVAARVASARRTRFVDSLYTTPLTQGTWFAVQALVGAMLALLVLALQVPFLVVFVAWLGIPSTLGAFALGALAVAMCAVALGLFCGIVVGDSSPLAAAGLAGGLSFLSFILFMVHQVVLEGPPTGERELLLRITSLSPVSLAGDAAGLGFAGVAPDDPWQPVVGLLALILGLAGAAWLSYTRWQGPLGWESARGRALVLGLVALVVAAPVATAELTFQGSGEDDAGYVPGANTWVAVVDHGAPIRDDSFSEMAIYLDPDLPAGQDVEVDVLVLLLAPANSSPRAVQIEVRGSDVIQVVEGGRRTSSAAQPDGQAPAPNDGRQRHVYRVPVTLRVVALEALGVSPSPIEVHTQFSADGRYYTSVGRVILQGEAPGVAWQLVGAGLVLPSSALVGCIVRKRNTR